MKNIWYGPLTERSGVDEAPSMLLILLGWGLALGTIVFLVPAMLILYPPVGIVLMLILAIVVIANGIKNAPWT